jgi:excisionase family DNA binding protein
MNKETTMSAADTRGLTQEEYLTIAEAARVLACKPWPVYQAIERGDLVAFRPLGEGTPFLIRPADLRAYIEAAAA